MEEKHLSQEEIKQRVWEQNKKKNFAASTKGRSAGQNVKLLYIRDYLHKYTDKNHPKSAKDIVQYLAEHHIKAERKTIYHDIDCLKTDFNEPIEYNPKKWGYYIAKPQFSLYELQILMDCVRASNFLSADDVSHISKKIGELANVYDYQKLRNAEWVGDEPVRPLNSELHNVELIQQAIEENRKISFRRYFYFPIHANRSDNGKLYIKSFTGSDVHVVSPKEMARIKGHYVLACYRTDSRMDSIVYPVQFLENIVVLPSERECIDLEKLPSQDDLPPEPKVPASELSPEEKLKRINSNLLHIRYMLMDFLEKNLEMKYTYQRKLAVTLVFKNEDALLILNEFGYETVLVPTGGVLCTATVRIPLQPEFYNWAFMNRSKITILSPQIVIDRYCEYVEAALLRYEIFTMPGQELMASLKQPAEKTGIPRALLTGQFLEELTKKRKNHTKLSKHIKNLSKDDES